MPLTGDFGKLQKLIGAFEKAAGKDFARSLALNLAAETISLVQREFRSQSDPYGDAWAPLKARAGMILSDTGHLRNSVAIAAATGSQIRIAIGASYAPFHQKGTKRMPQRMILPRDGDLPAAWASEYLAVTTSLLEQVFAKAAQ